MNIIIDERWQAFIEEAVKNGRYNSASDVIGDGLRLLKEREAKLETLRNLVNRSIAEGEEATEEEVDAALDAKAAELAKVGM